MNMWQGHPRSEVGLAEMVQACYVLNLCEETHLQWLAQSLGLFWAKVPDREGDSTAAGAAPSPASSPPPATPPKPEPPRKLQLLDPVAQKPMAFDVLLAGDAERVRSAAQLRVPAAPTSRESSSHQPLFGDRWFLGIISAILATQMTSHEIDLQLLWRSIIHGEVFKKLPLRKHSSLIKGVHLLLDRSESMQPFWRDQTQLVSRLRRLLGRPKVQTTWFEFDPLRPRETRLIWPARMPNRFRETTPVLLVTDFGIGMDPLAAYYMEWEPWLPVFQLARSCRCRVLALVAAPSNLWPAGLEQFVDGAVVWDRETSPQVATRLCRT